MLSLDKYNERDDLSLHLEWLSVFEKLISSNKLFKAAVLLGSFAKEKPDRLSDLDVLVWVDKDNMRNASQIVFGMKPFEIVHSWEKEFSENHFFKKCIYSNFVSAEVHVLSLENDFKVRKPYIVLKDINSVIESRIEPGFPPEHKDFMPLAGGADGLGWELFDMLKWWIRGEGDLVRHHLKKLSTKISDSSNQIGSRPSARRLPD